MLIQRWAVRIHKWLALAVGLQIILWIAGGVVMSVLPLNQVRGEHNMAEPPDAAFELGGILSLSDAAERSETEAVSSAQLLHWHDGRPVYLLETPENGSRLVDARDGRLLTPIDETTARAVALADYAGEANISAIEFFAQPSWEYRRAGPAWRVSFDDGEGTRVYVSSATGLVTARRNDAWRFFDFFWMLHIMDYEEREDFNTWHLRIFSILALITVLAGSVLLVIRVRRSLLSALKR